MVAKKKTLVRKAATASTSKKEAVKSKTPARAKAASAKPTAKKKAAAKKVAPQEKSSAKKSVVSKRVEKTTATGPKAAAKSVAQAKPRSLGKLIIKRKNNGNGVADANGGKKRARKLTEKQLSEFRQMLAMMRDQLAGQVTSLRGDSLKRHDEVNTSEDGTDAFERQFALTLASTEQDGIYEIDEALRRIDQGTYGICEMTGDPIEIERLRAIPFTRHSLSAQAEIESRTGANRQSLVRRSLL